MTDDYDPMEWFRLLAERLLESPTEHRGEWHAQDVSGSPLHMTHEAMDVRVLMPIPESADDLYLMTRANIPWADEHFAERVGGQPLNPAPSHKNWPWARHNANHQDQKCPTCGSLQPSMHPAVSGGGEVTRICPDPWHAGGAKFSHTYPERFWPKYAGTGNAPVPPVFDGNLHMGIRYRYGDLDDVVTLLRNKPRTRQAFLPVWFPEDTGATSGQRVPCTIGYHFMTRGNRVHCWYMMRSCDLVRHLQDDVYLAGRLLQWMCDRMNDGSMVPEENTGWEPGVLHMTISSLHAFVGDRWRLTQIAQGKYS